MTPVALPRVRLIEELGRTLILRKLSVGELKRFAAIGEVRSYVAGETLVRQGTVGTDLHIVLEGKVAIAVVGREGQEVPVSAVQQGDVLGEASIFMDVQRTASARAEKDGALVYAVPREKLFAYCEGNPKAGLKIFTFVIYSLLKRLGATTRELAWEREAVITREELERLQAYFPKSLEEMLEG